MVPAPFCAKRYISGPRYLPGDKRRMKTRRLTTRGANVDFRDAALKSREQYKKQQGLQMVALRNISFREELFMDYDTKYSLQLSSIGDVYRNTIKRGVGKCGCMKAIVAAKAETCC